MAAGNQMMTELLFQISTNTQSLKKGLDEAKGQFAGLSQGINKMKSLLIGAFSVTAIVAAGKAVFDMASEIDDVIGKIDDLGNSMNLALDAGKAKAIADVMGTDLDKIIGSSNALAKQFGITFSEGLDMIQKSLPMVGAEQEKFLKGITSTAAEYSVLNKDAGAFVSIVADGFRNATDWQGKLKAGVKDIGVSFEELGQQMNDDQIIQQRLIEATASFNSELATMFDGTNSKVDLIKVTLMEIALKGFRAIRDSLLSVINYVIDLYNESLAVRVAINYVILTFQTLWQTVKLVANLIIDAFKMVGKLVGAILRGEFSSIDDIIKESFKEAGEDFKTFGEDSAENFKTALENVLSKDKIKLIDLDAVQSDANKAANIIKQTLTLKKDDGMRMELGESPKAFTPITGDEVAPTTGIKTSLAEQKVAVQELTAEYKTLGETLQQNIGTVAVDAFSALGEMVVGTNDKTKKSFGQMVVSVLQGILKIIQAYLASAIAAVIASESKKGLFGLALAAVGVAAVSVMFKKLVPKFESGGLQTSNSMALVGEAGAELVSLPAGSRVSNNRDTMSILSAANAGGGTMNINFQGQLRGQDIWFINQEQTRIRGN